MTQRFINKARLLAERNRTTEAGTAYRKAIELNPNFAAAPFNLARALAARRRLNEAADMYSRWLEVYPDDHANWYRAAGVYLSIGDLDRYRGACRGMLDRFEKLAAEKPEIAEPTARTCALIPDAVADFARVERLAERCIAGTEQHSYRRYFVLAKGLTDYRAGRHEQALEWLRRFAPSPDGTHSDATGFAVLAMAHHQLGHADQARASFDSARAIVGRKPQNITRDGPWLEWLHFEILCREAEQTLSRRGSSTRAAATTTAASR